MKNSNDRLFRFRTVFAFEKYHTGTVCPNPVALYGHSVGLSVKRLDSYFHFNPPQLQFAASLPGLVDRVAAHQTPYSLRPGNPRRLRLPKYVARRSVGSQLCRTTYRQSSAESRRLARA